MSYTFTMGGYTELAMRNAVSGTLSLNEAIKYLKEDARIRTVRESLAHFCGIDTAEGAALRKALVELLVQSNPSAKRDSLEKNVRNWLAEGKQEISKPSAIQLAYAKKLPVEAAEAWMTRLCGETFHWRSPEDIVWIYGLQNRLDYASADSLRKKLSEGGFLDVPQEEASDSMTAIVRQEVCQLHSRAELEDFLLSYGPRLGKMHNTAYKLFRELMELLQEPASYSPASAPRDRRDSKAGPNDLIPDDRDMSVREVVTTYMFNEYIPRSRRMGKKRKGVEESIFSAMQRNIRQNWPDETTLSKMNNREIDVTRKVLILLFLATDGGESAYADMVDVDSEEIFLDMETRLNTMLADCGFPLLDSRTPFDWMVLYCMCADESIFVDDYMQRFLERVFVENSD